MKVRLYIKKGNDEKNTVVDIPDNATKADVDHMLRSIERTSNGFKISRLEGVKQ